ncbi:MAG: ATP-dependent DNA helicase RecG [Candidatus Paceibacterota bacterium]|jgi:ATP-dependent DNA helicase RecG
MLTLKTPISKLPMVGPIYLGRLRKVGIEKVEDLLFYYPFRYDDFSDVRKISDVGIGETVSVAGKIIDIENIRTRRRRMFLTQAIVEDDSGAIKVVWFNQPYIADSLKKGVNVSLSGKITFAKEELQLSNPAYELLGGRPSLHTARLVPVYHETEGLSSKWIRAHIRPIMPLVEKIQEFLPKEIIDRQKLFSLKEAIREIHFPADPETAKAAKRRLAFDELFMIHLYLALQKKRWQQNSGVGMEFSNEREEEVKNFVLSLPFKLTDAQRSSSWSIIKDLGKNKPMNRLLEGDVGSGKTLVALIAALFVIRSGYQVAFMAPTEILARQHYLEAVRRFGKNGIRLALLTGSESKLFDGKEKELPSGALIKEIQSGKIKLLIGTHALIQEKVSFKDLALSIVDEQHRFGIDQRALLQKEILGIHDGLKTVPHLLSMTATPIPRTLALTVYGDLDLSILNEMPKGRREIITKLVAPGNRDLAYQFIRDQVKKGRQVFVICPLIEESDVLEVRSATEEYEKLRKKIYPDLAIGLLHGKMKPKEKESAMKDFTSGKTDILVSTSVVEVGIDVPNATVMLIEGSDRFGLAQLHQFRGRVGRGEHQSFCFLFTDSTSGVAHKRLKALVKCNNGFELAEKDLEMRGPGELVGVRQSGLPDLAMASLSDTELIKIARDEAIALIERDADVSTHPKLEERLKQFKEKVHFE